MDSGRRSNGGDAGDDGDDGDGGGGGRAVDPPRRKKQRRAKGRTTHSRRDVERLVSSADISCRPRRDTLGTLYLCTPGESGYGNRREKACRMGDAPPRAVEQCRRKETIWYVVKSRIL